MEPIPGKLTRRDFLKLGAAASATAFLPSCADQPETGAAVPQPVQETRRASSTIIANQVEQEEKAEQVFLSTRETLESFRMGYSILHLNLPPDAEVWAYVADSNNGDMQIGGGADIYKRHEAYDSMYEFAANYMSYPNESPGRPTPIRALLDNERIVIDNKFLGFIGLKSEQKEPLLKEPINVTGIKLTEVGPLFSIEHSYEKGRIPSTGLLLLSWGWVREEHFASGNVEGNEGMIANLLRIAKNHLQYNASLEGVITGPNLRELFLRYTGGEGKMSPSNAVIKIEQEDKADLIKVPPVLYNANLINDNFIRMLNGELFQEDPNSGNYKSGAILPFGTPVMIHGYVMAPGDVFDTWSRLYIPRTYAAISLTDEPKNFTNRSDFTEMVRAVAANNRNQVFLTDARNLGVGLWPWPQA